MSDPERDSQEAEEWFNNLPEVPPEEVDKTDDLIYRAMDQMTGKPPGSFGKRLNIKKIEDSVPLAPELSKEIPFIDSPDRREN